MKLNVDSSPKYERLRLNLNWTFKVPAALVEPLAVTKTRSQLKRCYQLLFKSQLRKPDSILYAE